MRTLKWIAVCAGVALGAFNSVERTNGPVRLSDSLLQGYRLYTFNDTLAYLYTFPRFTECFFNIFEDMGLTVLEVADKDNALPLAGVALSTAVFIYYDQDLIDASTRFGRFVGLGTDNHTYNLLHTKTIPFYVPVSLPAALYYLGDGLMELSVNAGIYLYGGIRKDARALRTASELTEGLCAVGILTQALKRATGRETPMRATEPRGVWRFFPSFSEYQSSVPRYDAFPSGHLASAMVTTTVLSMNYPEYRFIKPLCFTLMTLCGYQMMNNGVHWISDYPLALAMGYAVGRTAVERGRIKEVRTGKPAAAPYPPSFRPRFFACPIVLGQAACGLSLGMTF